MTESTATEPKAPQPTTTAPAITLDKVAELDGGGQRLAVSGAAIAVATGTEVTLWRDLHREFEIAAPGAIDRLRFRDGGSELLAAPYVLDLAAKNWAVLPDLRPALASGLEGRSSGQLLVRRADWSLDGIDLLAYVERVPPRGVGRGGDTTAPQARLLWMNRARDVTAVPWTGARFELDSVVIGQRSAVTAGDALIVWDRASHAQVATLRPHSLVVRDLAFSSQDRWLASVSNDHQVVIIDTRTWQPVASWQAHDGDATAVAFHPTLAVLATAGQDRLLRLWSIDGARLAEAPLGGTGNAIAFDPGGQRVLVATDERIVVFAVKTH